jgi:threonine/homoserine/homoserine lactone efflux protein
MLTTEFLIASLIVVLIPGTGAVFTVPTGLAQGRRAVINSPRVQAWLRRGFAGLCAQLALSERQ